MITSREIIKTTAAAFGVSVADITGRDHSAIWMTVQRYHEKVATDPEIAARGERIKARLREAAHIRNALHQHIDRLPDHRQRKLALHMGVIEPPRLTQHEPEHPHSEDAGNPWGMA